MSMQINGRIWHFEVYERVFLNQRECESVVDTADASVKLSGKGDTRAIRHALATALRAIRASKPRVSPAPGATILRNFDVSWLPMPIGD
jgi:hypothetical protein